MTVKNIPSKSEERGIAQVQDSDLNLYSVGISTAGWAEVQIAKAHPERKIIATTIDEKGAKFSQGLFEQESVSDQIRTKLEDVTQPLLYEDHSFDFVYARLVLHYLPKQQLDHALKELYRILKPEGRIFVVVLSDQCSILKLANTTFDSSTRLTTTTTEKGSYTRYYHSEATLRGHLRKAGFLAGCIESYEEHLCYDYERKQIANTLSSLLEALAVKK